MSVNTVKEVISKVQQMAMMQAMCQQEIESLQENLSSFLVESEKFMQCLNGIELQNGADRLDGNNLFAILMFERYMSQLSSVSNMARKFNLHLLDKPLVDLKKYFKTDIARRQSHVPTGYMEWDNILRGHKLLESAVQCSGNGEDKWCLTSQSIEENLPNPECYIITPKWVPPPNRVTPNAAFRCATFSESLKADSDKETDLCGSIGVVSKDLSKFYVGCKFTAIITHVKDYKLKVFYVNELGHTDLFVLKAMFQLQRYDCNKSLPPHNEVFGIDVNSTRIMRAVRIPGTSNKAPERFLLIDAGMEIRYKESMQLFCLPSKYREIPAQAIKCMLVGADEANMNSDKNEKDLVDVLHRIAMKNVDFRVVKNSGNILFVMLEEHNTSSGKETIEDSKITSTRTTSWNPFLETSITEENPCLLTTYDEENNKSVSLQSIEELSYSETSNADIFGNKRLDQQYISLTETKARNVTPGMIITIDVTHIESAIRFYGNIVGTENQLKKSSSWNVLNANGPIQELLEPPQLNEIVFAQYNVDAFWYRAKVIKIDDTKKLFTVFYVDYGNSNIITLENMAACTSSSHVEPFRAVRCRLAEIEDHTCDDKRQQKLGEQLLLVNILNQTLEVEVLDIVPNTELTVRIVSKDFQDVPDMMLQHGYVKKILRK